MKIIDLMNSELKDFNSSDDKSNAEKLLSFVNKKISARIFNNRYNPITEVVVMFNKKEENQEYFSKVLLEHHLKTNSFDVFPIDNYSKEDIQDFNEIKSFFQSVFNKKTP